MKHRVVAEAVVVGLPRADRRSWKNKIVRVTLDALPRRIREYFESILGKAQRALVVETHRRFMVEWAAEAIARSPVRSGRFRASWGLSFGSPVFRALGQSAALLPLSRSQLNSIAQQADGYKTGFLTGDAATGRDSYHFTIDKGRRKDFTRNRMSGSLQAPYGVSSPAAIRAMERVQTEAVRIDAIAARVVPA